MQKFLRAGPRLSTDGRWVIAVDGAGATYLIDALEALAALQPIWLPLVEAAVRTTASAMSQGEGGTPTPVILSRELVNIAARSEP